MERGVPKVSLHQVECALLWMLGSAALRSDHRLLAAAGHYRLAAE